MVTLYTFARGKTDLPRENIIYLSSPEVNLSRVSFFPGAKVTLKKTHPGIYKGMTELNFMTHKHIFWAQIENNVLENHADQREIVLLFSLLSFTLLQRARRSRVVFLQRLILVSETKYSRLIAIANKETKSSVNSAKCNVY